MHHRRQREAQPRIVGEVVVAEREGVAPALRLESKAQMASDAGRMAQADSELMLLVERADLREQLAVAPLFRLKVRRADQHQRLGVGGKLLAAAVRALQIPEHGIQPLEILVGIAIVPNAQGEQRDDVHEVVVEHNRELELARRVRAALFREEVQHIDRDDVGVGLLRDPVPVVHDVETVGAGAAVEGRDGALEKNLLAGGAKTMRAQSIAQPRQRCTECLAAEAGDNLAPGGAAQGGFDKTRRLIESNFHE